VTTSARGVGRDANPIDGDHITFWAYIRDGKVAAGADEIITTVVREVRTPGGLSDPTTIDVTTGAQAKAYGETFRGCEVARRAAIAVNKMVEGRTAEEVFALDVGKLIAAIGGVPAENERCVLTVIGALRAALIDAQVKALVDATYESRKLRVK
jgi:hypothetical protein